MEKISGFFISLEPSQEEAVRRKLEKFGYSADGGGLKEALFDWLDEDSVDRREKAANFAIDNKELISLGIDAASRIINILGKRKVSV